MRQVSRARRARTVDARLWLRTTDRKGLEPGLTVVGLGLEPIWPTRRHRSLRFCSEAELRAVRTVFIVRK